MSEVRRTLYQSVLLNREHLGEDVNLLSDWSSAVPTGCGYRTKEWDASSKQASRSGLSLRESEVSEVVPKTICRFPTQYAFTRVTQGGNSFHTMSKLEDWQNNTDGIVPSRPRKRFAIISEKISLTICTPKQPWPTGVMLRLLVYKNRLYTLHFNIF